MYIALKLLRAWSGMHGSYAFSADVVYIVNKWIDEDMKGPIPWPDNPFFTEWAEKNGLIKIGNLIGWHPAVEEGSDRSCDVRSRADGGFNTDGISGR